MMLAVTSWRHVFVQMYLCKATTVRHVPDGSRHDGALAACTQDEFPLKVFITFPRLSCRLLEWATWDLEELLGSMTSLRQPL